jgi:Bax protein
MWCFSKGCGFVPIQRNQGAVHEVTRFDSLEHAVTAYMLNLNRHHAYEAMRMIRAQNRAAGIPVLAEDLVQGLLNYSERREAYLQELLDMLRVNRAYMSL